MKVVVFGSTGPLGQIITTRALDAGHSVTAFVRSPETLPFTHPQLKVVTGDIYNQATVDAAVLDQEAVISALGIRGRVTKMICADGARAIIAAMKTNKVRRLIAVSAYGARETHRDSLYTRGLWLGIRKHMADKDQMEEVIRASGLDWVMVRPAAYIKHQKKRTVVVADHLHGIYPHITRHEVAELMVRQLTTSVNFGKALAIQYSRAA